MLKAWWLLLRDAETFLFQRSLQLVPSGRHSLRTVQGTGVSKRQQGSDLWKVSLTSVAAKLLAFLSFRRFSPGSVLMFHWDIFMLITSLNCNSASCEFASFHFVSTLCIRMHHMKTKYSLYQEINIQQRSPPSQNQTDSVIRTASNTGESTLKAISLKMELSKHLALPRYSTILTSWA